MPDADELSLARGLIEDARSAFRRGDNDGATRAANAALAIARSTCDDRLISSALTWLGRAASRNGDRVTQRRLIDEALAAARRTGDPADTIPPLHMLATLARMEGDLERARRGYEGTRSLARNDGQAGMELVETLNLASVDVLAGDAVAAFAHAHEALRAAQGAGAARTVPVCYSILAGVAILRCDLERAARLLGAAEASIGDTGTVFDPDDRQDHDARASLAAARLGDERYRALNGEGRVMSAEGAMALAMHDGLPV